MKKKLFTYKEVYLPERRKVQPIGRLTILGKKLSVEETSNYIKANMSNYNLK